MRAAAYIRVSTEEQRIHGLSVDAQKDALTEYARSNGMTIVDYYIDAGLTARKKLSHRKELLRLLDDVEKGLIDIIIFTKLDRWFRNIADYYKIQEKLDKYKVNWRTIYEAYDTSTANGRLHINIMLSIAQDEADRTSERIKAVFENKRARGETPANRAPLGYKIVNSKLIINEETKQLTKDIFNYYDLHHSVSGCVRMVREKYGYKIHDYTIRRMFQNKIYIGEYRGYKNFCMPLITKEQFERIAKFKEDRIYRNQLATGRVYLFSSLVFCKECSHSMSCCYTINKDKHVSKEYHYYRCREAVVNLCCPHKKRINEDVLEAYLLDCLKDEPKNQLIMVEETKQYKAKGIDTGKVKKRIERLVELYLDGLIDKISYKLEYDTLIKQLKACSNTHTASYDWNIYLYKNFLSLYKLMQPHERKTFWLGIIEKIIVDKDNYISFYFRE